MVIVMKKSIKETIYQIMIVVAVLAIVMLALHGLGVF
jgi:hypothetical protein